MTLSFLSVSSYHQWCKLCDSLNSASLVHAWNFYWYGKHFFFWNFSIINKILFSLEGWGRKHLIWNSYILRELMYVKAFQEFVWFLRRKKYSPSFNHIFGCFSHARHSPHTVSGYRIRLKMSKPQEEWSLLVETSTEVTSGISVVNSMLEACAQPWRPSQLRALSSVCLGAKGLTEGGWLLTRTWKEEYHFSRRWRRGQAFQMEGTCELGPEASMCLAFLGTVSGQIWMFNHERSWL